MPDPVRGSSDTCGAHGVGIIPIRQNQAHERMLKSDVKYRFAIDAASLDS